MLMDEKSKAVVAAASIAGITGGVAGANNN